MKLIKYWMTVVIFAVTISIEAQEEDSAVKDFEWEAGYVGDIGRNFDGGISKGNTVMGVLSYGATIRTEKIWKGGEFYFQGMTTHGKGLSANYVGDQQFISNIENDNYWFFVEKLYYRQYFERGWLTIGLQDLNQDFLVSEGGSYFLNSSFGIPSTYPLNFSVPIYPKTALAISGMYTINDRWSISTAVFDGDCGSLDRDRTNTKWTLRTDEGFLMVGELAFTPGDRLQIKGGGMYHTADFPDLLDTTKIHKGVYGMYALIDYSLLKNQDKHVSCFTQVAYHPTKANYNSLYVGGGVVVQGYLFNRTNDYLGLGAAYARFFDDTFECDIECSYCFCISQHVALMPSFHYVIHPGGQQSGLANATAGMLRVVLTK
ncbi:MAG: carbohydrate porin [Bacteroidales bacterium]